MEAGPDEEKLLRSAALQNANAILLARQRAEEELIRAKEALERRTVELAQSLSMLRATLESTTDAILVTDLEGRVTDLNEKCLRMWGFSREAAVHKKHQQLQEASAALLRDPERFLARIGEIYASRPPETFDLLEFCDGRVYERHSGIQRIDGQPVGRVWSYRDITESKRAERERRAQSEWFKVTLGSIGDAVITVDTGGVVTFLNPVAEALTGWSAAEAAGRTMGEVMHMLNEGTGMPALNPVTRAIAEGVVVGLANHTILIARDGSQIPIEDSAAPIKDPAGPIIGAVMVFHDVSERRQKEKELGRLFEAEQQARSTAEEANSAKDQFLAALSHELRTPLTPVLAIVSLLLDQPGISGELAEDLETIRRNVVLEARLIDDLLDVTRITRGKLELHYESVPADRLVENAINVCLTDLENKGLSLVRKLDASRRPIQVDGMRVTQILWNLLKNAIKFTPKGGVVTVRSGIASEEGADWLTIEVQDTGLGIEPSQAYQIFRPFAQGGRKITRQYGGLGLGLSISSGIAQAHGGAITVASGGVGRGSTFTLTLPCSAPDESRPSAKAAPLRVPWTAGPARAAERKAEHPLRVLLVEDHADTAAVMARLLGRMGYDVVCAATASEAIQVAGKEVKEAGIDLVVSDVGLPDGSGLDMMKQLSTAYGLRGIAISGNGGERDIAKSVAAGFGRHLVKPVDVATLRQAIAAMVKGT